MDSARMRFPRSPKFPHIMSTVSKTPMLASASSSASGRTSWMPLRRQASTAPGEMSIATTSQPRRAASRLSPPRPRTDVENAPRHVREDLAFGMRPLVMLGEEHLGRQRRATRTRRRARGTLVPTRRRGSRGAAVRRRLRRRGAGGPRRDATGHSNGECAWQDSNLRPRAPEARALSPELQARRTKPPLRAPVSFGGGHTLPGPWSSLIGLQLSDSNRRFASRGRRAPRRRCSGSRSVTRDTLGSARRRRSRTTASPSSPPPLSSTTPRNSWAPTPLRSTRSVAGSPSIPVSSPPRRPSTRRFTTSAGRWRACRSTGCSV